jgi:hypothetical protein
MKEEHGLQKQVGMIVRSMSYITSKFTKIVDWRLAVFYYIMIVACFGGILASLFLGKTFLFDETPVGIVSAYAYGGSAYTALQADTAAGNVDLCSSAKLVRTRAFSRNSRFFYFFPLGSGSASAATELPRPRPSALALASLI